MVDPLVSVIITTYNRPTYIKQAVESVIKQTYDNIEILVVDDGSEENYAKIICDKYIICTYHYKKNGGLASARNFGVSIAKGEYVAFLDDDDFWREDKIEKQVELLENYPKIDCVHSSAIIVNETGQETGQIIGASQNKIQKRSGYVFWDALGVWVVKSPTPLIRKSVFKTDMQFDENIKVGEDVDFYQRMFYRHMVLYINEPLAYYREYNNNERLSVQTEKYVGIERTMYENFLKMGIWNPFYLWLIAIKLAKSSLIKQHDKSIVNKITSLISPLYFLKKYSCEFK
ncbi:glycosyltransferase family 2 protein [Flavobacterium frigoris]|uniref:Glycosyl transferase, family 2 n=1 Tax=Flavobacterium frigoris (strain PS1) TaxID=1086011 RepID=H7FM81_FLAFP|nr:glycosyltransferase family 2 protein [Flavobacterium frigoris]EIA10419.1 glycosyl transferase, family 2 [Flavobacterium frigoris PS1]